MKEELNRLPASHYTGEVKVEGIGVCSHAERVIGIGNLRNLNIRTPDSHKGQAGRILIIGGGAYSGAPALAALAALRTGAAIVTVAAPSNVASTIASFSPDLIVRCLSGQRLCSDDLPLITKLACQHDVIVMGMGLGNEDGVEKTARRIVPVGKKLVLDADALPAVEEVKGSASDMNKRIEEVMTFSKEKNVVTLLKGKVDIISDGKKVMLNRTGNAGMSVGGTGDVLAGITGALLAANSPLKAAACAAYINGAAGDLAFKEKGYGLLATDIIERITDVMRE
jgi:NAD(P)H-hydrate epimerase